jgi:DNA-binding LytR/AlgR family response regulator
MVYAESVDLENELPRSLFFQTSKKYKILNIENVDKNCECSL